MTEPSAVPAVPRAYDLTPEHLQRATNAPIIQASQVFCVHTSSSDAAEHTSGLDACHDHVDLKLEDGHVNEYHAHANADAQQLIQKDAVDSKCSENMNDNEIHYPIIQTVRFHYNGSSSECTDERVHIPSHHRTHSMIKSIGASVDSILMNNSNDDGDGNGGNGDDHTNTVSPLSKSRFHALRTRSRCANLLHLILPPKLLTYSWLLCATFNIIILILLDTVSSDVRGVSNVASSFQYIFAMILYIIAMLMNIGWIIITTSSLFYYIFAQRVTACMLASMYLTTVIFFGHVYYMCTILGRTSISRPSTLGDSTEMVITNSDSISSTHCTRQWCNFIHVLYFSMTTMTTTGFGDIQAVQWYTKMIAAVQQIIAILYTAGIFSIGLTQFKLEKEALKEPRKVYECAKSFGCIQSKFPRIDRCRKFLLDYILLVTLTIQFTMVGILYAVDLHSLTNHRGADDDITGSIIALFFQILQLSLMILSCFRLIHQINVRHISPCFLFQSDLSTVLFFAGLYFTSWIWIGDNAFHLGAFDSNDSTIAAYLMQFYWYSLSLMTTTGYGDVAATHVATRLLACVQMLVSVLYHAIILNLGVSTLAEHIEEGDDKKQDRN